METTEIPANSKTQGNAGMGIAIAWFTTQGYRVSIPLTDSQDYDLVVDMNGELKKIQVKTSFQQPRGTNYQVELRSRGGTLSYGTKSFELNKCDFVFVVVGNGDRYLIPRSVITSVSGIQVGAKYTEYKVDDSEGLFGKTI